MIVIVLSAALVAAGPAAAAVFVETTLLAGIDFTYVNGASDARYLPEAMGSGAAFFDSDGDGFLDLYIVNGTHLGRPRGPDSPANALYRNRRDGTFHDVTQPAGVGDRQYGMGAATGDYDNDGDQDLYVTNFGPDVLYRNGGEGTFLDVTRQSGVDSPGWGSSAAFADYDMDGDLDLYVANYADFDVSRNQECRQGTVRAYCGPLTYPGQSGVLYRNEGGGSFRDATREARLYSTEGRQLGAVFADYDNDGDPDLFVANDMTPNFLFRNAGDGTFTDVGFLSGVAYNGDGEAESAMGTDWGDYDNDGHLDLVLATFQWMPNTLYHSDGDGFFSDATARARIRAPSIPFLGMSATFLDYDSDGFLDIFVANGHLDENVEKYDSAACYAQKNQLFRNLADGAFAEVTALAGPGLQVDRVSHGAAFGDYDNDGDVDIFVSDSAAPHCTLLRNDGGNANHYLQLDLVGTRSNRDALGARVRVVAGDLVQVKEVRSGYGYLSASDRRLHFGLGSRGSVERIEIRWPRGGLLVVEDVSADQLLLIEEE